MVDCTSSDLKLFAMIKKVKSDLEDLHYSK